MNSVIRKTHAIGSVLRNVTRPLVARVALLVCSLGALALNPLPSLAAPAVDVRIVRNVENPARQSVHVRGIFDLAVGEPDKFVNAYVVPAGKRLVVEHVSAFLGVPPDQKSFFVIYTRLAGMLEPHTLVAHDQGVMTNTYVAGTKAIFVASQPTRFYADPGTEILMLVRRTSADGTAGGHMVMSGHLVDVPQN